MSPQPYVLYVNSRPKADSGIEDKVWEKWYGAEHLPDLVNSGTCIRGALYRETFDFASASKEEPFLKYLAVYQTGFAEALSTTEFAEKVRHTSDLFPNKMGSLEAGDFDGRNYKLIQDYDPNRVKEKPSLFIVTVEMQPADEEDFDKWYREEHLHLVRNITGYRRSLRYELGARTPITVGEPGKYLTIHELDDIQQLDSKEAQAANNTPWTIKNISESKVVIARGWELVHSEGFN